VIANERVDDDHIYKLVIGGRDENRLFGIGERVDD
jgi:hypothetical protein